MKLNGEGRVDRDGRLGQDGRLMTYRDGWGLVVLMVLATACASQRAQLSGAWVVAGSPARAGVAQQPRNAQPLVLDGSDGCIPAVAFIDPFCNPCKEHETEGGASTGMSGPHPMCATP